MVCGHEDSPARQSIMPKIIQPLTDKAITAGLLAFKKSEEKKKSFSDGKVQGLRLFMYRCGDGSVTAHWEFRQVAKTLPDGAKIKACEKRVGVYPTMGLREAREKAEEYRRLVESGKNPVDEVRRRQMEAEAKEEERKRNAVTFSQAAERWIDDCKDGWAKKSGKRARNTFYALRKHAFPVIGDIPIADLSAHDVYAVMIHDNFYTTVDESHSRSVRRYINDICEWAYCNGIRKTMDAPASSRKGDILAGLLRPLDAKVPKSKPLPMIKVSEAHEFFRELLSMPTNPARDALIFGMLTGLRGQSFRTVKWSAINWDVPSIMVEERDRKEKDGKFECFLSPFAVQFLKTRPRFIECDFIFTYRGRNALSRSSVDRLIERMNEARVSRGLTEWVDVNRKDKNGKFRKAVPHALCRSLMRTWAEDDEHGNLFRFPGVVSELVLDHDVSTAKGDVLGGAYRRGNMRKSRIDLMNYYGRFLITGKWPDEEDGEECKEWLAIIGKK